MVKTRSGQVRGVETDGVFAFKGIPYGAVPEGDLRFLAPVPAEPWDGVRDAVAFGPASPQGQLAPGVPAVWQPGDGLGCLNLNVWTPGPGSAGLPVLVWLYGGGWIKGWSGLPQYDGGLLARGGAVVVTLDHRLGFEGYGWVDGAPANRGLLDQIAALEWVAGNIAAFGGDPGNVTVFGQSAGAASAVLLAAAPRTDGLLRRVIAQSVPDGYQSVEEGRRIGAAVAAISGSAPGRDALAEVRPGAILAAQGTVSAGRQEGGTVAPVIDGDLVTGPPWAVPDPGVDLVCGYTHEEYRSFGPVPPADEINLAGIAAALGLPAEAAAVYAAAEPDPSAAFVALMSDALVRVPTTRLAEEHAAAGGRTWLYDFTWRSPLLGAAHGIDIPFTFGLPKTPMALRNLGRPPEEFAVLSGAMRESWTAFATTGDPGWTRFDPVRRTVRRWDVPPSEGPDPLAAVRSVWPAGN
ncbi:carboxylesterase family protein [Actinocorallia longicatena]|uniref:Carboxylic ester hydrolase n=1 Tax=Actinocorallia longicatena TaxID=111803 RepID=A0ABP6Q4L9_9ACTN